MINDERQHKITQAEADEARVVIDEFKHAQTGDGVAPEMTRIQVEARRATPAAAEAELADHHPRPVASDTDPTVQRRHHVTKGQSCSMVDRLVKRLGDLDGPRRSLRDRLALYRGFHTAGLELADNVDDSFGVIGEARTEAWLTYLSIDWRTTGIDPEAYWRDICELRIWEPYAIDHDNSLEWFTSATVDDVDMIEPILLELETEHRDAILDWEAEEALQALADLYIATGSHDRLAGVAERLGSRWWRPIEAMATALLEAGNRDAAVAVFAAADQPGMQRDYLRRRCEVLCGSQLSTTPRSDRAQPPTII